MKNSKSRAIFGLGRRWLFALALFVLVFVVANVVRIQAGTGDNASGWLWGGMEDGLGNNTSVGWISVNNTNQGGSASYGVNIPVDQGNLNGYAWSENIGWVSFNQSDLTGCPQGQCVAKRDGINIKGWARILSIRDAAAVGNSGGWQGWVALSGAGYGLKLDTANNKFQSGSYAWSDELGWVDFSRVTFAPPCAPLCGSAINQTFCAGSSGPTSNLCAAGTPSGVSGSGPWSWTCDCGGSTVACTTLIAPQTLTNGQCGTADGGSFCGGRIPTNEELCSAGTPVPGASSLNLDVYEVTWQCQGVCGGANADCSAKGTKACGWIETTPQ